MAQIQIHTIKTKVLQHFWERTDLDNESSDDTRRVFLEEFTRNLTESLSTMNRTSQIRWVIYDDTNQFIKTFATKHNDDYDL